MAITEPKAQTTFRNGKMKRKTSEWREEKGRLIVHYPRVLTKKCRKLKGMKMKEKKRDGTLT